MSNEGEQSMENTQSGKPRVFVYGTLKDGEANNRLLQTGGASKLGDFTVIGPYRMVDLGYYPGVCRVSGQSDSPIVGEVWEVDEETLHSLDILEGHPSYYKRVKVPTDYKNAWIYLLPEEDVDGLPAVEGGNWSG
jgi:gamma-glutamylcyclotransferase (GGCT)/AIG2-like uncharacterized protein YtfP